MRDSIFSDVRLAPERRTSEAATRTPSLADEVSWVKDRSGLSWDQMGRIFGVSHRAVHMWAKGGRLSESHARALREFVATVKDIEVELACATPESLRDRLFEVEADGFSIIDRLRRERSSSAAWGRRSGRSISSMPSASRSAPTSSGGF